MVVERHELAFARKVVGVQKPEHHQNQHGNVQIMWVNLLERDSDEPAGERHCPAFEQKGIARHAVDGGLDELEMFYLRFHSRSLSIEVRRQRRYDDALDHELFGQHNSLVVLVSGVRHQHYEVLLPAEMFDCGFVVD